MFGKILIALFKGVSFTVGIVIASILDIIVFCALAAIPLAALVVLNIVSTGTATAILTVVAIAIAIRIVIVGSAKALTE